MDSCSGGISVVAWVISLVAKGKPRQRVSSALPKLQIIRLLSKGGKRWICGECKPPLWCLTKCGDWRYSSCVSCSVNTTRRRLLHVTNFTRTARSKRCRSQSGPCQDRGYAPGISERDVRKVWKADLSLCQVRIARTRSELAFDADRGRQDRGPTDPLRTSGRAIKAAGGRVQALS